MLRFKDLFSTYRKYAIFLDGDMRTLPLRRAIKYSFAMKQMLQIEEIVQYYIEQLSLSLNQLKETKYTSRT